METNHLETKTMKLSKVNKMFVLIQTKNKKWHIGCAGKLVTRKEFRTAKEAEEYLTSKPWDILINVIALTTQTIKNNEEDN